MKADGSHGSTTRPALALLLFGAASCGDTGALAGTGDGGLGEGADGGPEPVRALFLPSADPMPFGSVPWPDDLYLDDRGRVAVGAFPGPESARPYLDQLAAALADLDGFGASSPVYVHFDGAIDSASLPRDAQASLARDASAFLVDVDTSSPEAFERVPVEVRVEANDRRLVLRPMRALVPSRRYAAVVTRRVRGADGRDIEGGSRFVAVRDREVPLDDANEREARERYTPVFETLAASGLARDDVAAMAVFRVQSVLGDLEDAHALVRSAALTAPAPTQALSGAALDAALGAPDAGAVGSATPGGAPHAHVGWMVHGSFAAPGLLSAGSGVHGAFERNEGGELRVKEMDEVYFTLVLPRGTAGSPLPVAIFQHGLARERSDGLAAANALAGAGYAVFMLDAPFHGLAVAGADTVNRFTGKAGPDGFGDVEGDFAGVRDLDGDLAPLHPFYYRDAARQGVVDLMVLVRLLEEAKWTTVLAAADPQLRDLTFDATRIGFAGVDLGAEMGIMLASVEPSVGALALGFAGGPTLEGWIQSPARAALFEELARRVGRDPAWPDHGDDDPRLWPEAAVWQMLVDRADPVANAATLRGAPVNVLAWMALDDEVVPNGATEALGRALGAPLVGGSPRYTDGLETTSIASGSTLSGNFAVGDQTVTRVLYQVGPATHDTLVAERGEVAYAHPVQAPFVALPDPVATKNPTADVLTQLVFFFESWRGCDPPTPESACAGSVLAPR